LADDLRTVIGETQTASNEQAGIWATGQRESAKAWKDAAKDMKGAAGDLTTASEAAENAVDRWKWKVWIWVLIASVTPTLVLLTALWLWLEPIVIVQKGVVWLRLGTL
ncbi:IncQ-type mobilization protein MobB, partial [Aeromonas caviae]|uniref:IncQ-type mobilization protein MobB n=1 Tax=Aeromonas caviae TaxID=648 RepID=UPI001005FD38